MQELFNFGFEFKNYMKIIRDFKDDLHFVRNQFRRRRNNL